MAAKVSATGRFRSPEVLDRDPGWQLVSRIAASEKLRRSQRWMRFFEDRLNFQYEYDDAHGFGYFRNMKPSSGQDKIYRVQWNRRGYCRIAYLSNLSANGTALILEGTDMSSAEAGQEFVTSNQWISQLRDRLSLKSRARIPHFEALLAADLAVNSAPRFEIVSMRTIDTK
ncbi:MAG TPA: hypothetical protein VH325_14745 [Bryobacteraceae bacterium]|nr:hypothetical protein [Bryobacteraceae bacterium]